MLQRVSRQALAQAEASEHDVALRMDRLPVTALHIAAIVLCALGFMFDLLEIALGSVLSAVFSTPPQVVPAQQLSLLLSSVYIGAIAGAPMLGWVADRHGRRNTLMGILLWLALMSVGAAASNDVVMLTWCRGLAGLALGAYPPIMMAYLTDMLPSRRRGMLSFVVFAIASIGPVLGIFMIRWLTPLQPLGLEAWRWGFLVGGVGAAVFGLLFRALPESPRWLQAKGRQAQAEMACQAFEQSSIVLSVPPDEITQQRETKEAAAQLPQGAAGKKRWAMVGALFLLSPWSTVAFPLLTGAVLSQKGFKISDTLLYVGLSSFGPLVGALLASTVVDRVERRVALVGCAAAMLVSGVWFIASDVPLWLIISSVLFSFFGFLYISTINLYGAELFPTSTRASAISGAWALNRLGAAAAPLILIPLLRNGGGPPAMFAVIAATLVGTIVLLAVAPRGQQRRSVQ